MVITKWPNVSLTVFASAPVTLDLVSGSHIYLHSLFFFCFSSVFHLFFYCFFFQCALNYRSSSRVSVFAVRLHVARRLANLSVSASLLGALWCSVVLGGARWCSALGPGGGIIKSIQIMLLKLGMCRDVVSVAAGHRRPPLQGPR